MVGSTISHYRIVSELGRGGMGIVYKAEDERLNRTVAIKVLPHRDLGSEEELSRFTHEAQAAAALTHPHITTVYEIDKAVPTTDDPSGKESDEREGRSFIVMEYVDGLSLKEKIEEGPLRLEETIRLAIQVAAGLEAAHEHGIVHRDIKPANVMLTKKGEAKIMDFGLAKLADQTVLTKTGTTVGTAAYMSPEQARGESVDPRSDIFAFGVLVYEMIVGQKAFQGAYAEAVIYSILNVDPEPLTAIRTGVPMELERIVVKALAKNPKERYQGMSDLLVDLRGLEKGLDSRETSTMSSVVAARNTFPIRTLVVYSLVTIIVLAVVYGAMMLFGLPTWVMLSSAVLMAVGLPIVLFAEHTERDRTVLNSGEQAKVIGLKRWLTRRRAAMGGIIAMSGLSFVAAAFMVLRIVGVGPFATLVSSGALPEQSVVVMAPFENRTDDPGLGTTVTVALQVDLAQSPLVEIMGDSRIRSTLTRMERDENTVVNDEIAREIAIREGASAVLFGDIGPAGSGFVLSARMQSPEGEELLHLRSEAADDSEIITAINRLSNDLREEIGESLVSIRASEPLYDVTTRSLEALKLYSEAEKLTEQTETRRALDKLRQAVEIDSTFGMAFRKIAVVIHNLEDPFELQVEAASRAYALRNRMTERERLLTTAYYYSSVELNREKLTAAYESVLEKYPLDIVALHNLQIYYRFDRRFAECERMARKALQVADGYIFREAFLLALIPQGKLDEARLALLDWETVFPRDPEMTDALLRQAYLDNRLDTVRVLIDSLKVRGTGSDYERIVNNWVALWAGETGRVGEYNNAIRRISEIQFKNANNAAGLVTLLESVQNQFYIFGNREDAIRDLEVVLIEHPLDSMFVASRPYLRIARLFVLLDDFDRAEEYLARYDNEMPPQFRRENVEFDATVSFIQNAQSDLQKVIESLYLVRERVGFQRRFLSDIGQYYEEMGSLDSAITSYEQFVTLPDYWAGDLAPGKVARSYERLGDLYTTKGDLDKAIEYYSKFIERWQYADPILQPRVQAARERVGELLDRMALEPNQ